MPYFCIILCLILIMKRVYGFLFEKLNNADFLQKNKFIECCGHLSREFWGKLEFSHVLTYIFVIRGNGTHSILILIWSSHQMLWNSRISSNNSDLTHRKHDPVVEKSLYKQYLHQKYSFFFILSTIQNEERL